MRIYIESTIPSYVVARPARDILQAARQQHAGRIHERLMRTLKNDAIETTEGDQVLREIWRVKDELSAARGHNIDRLFAEARGRQKHSGHPVVNLQNKRRKA